MTNIRLSMIVACLFLASLAALSFAINERTRTLNETNQHICTQIEQLKDVFRASLYESESTLPKLAYFRAHPDELRQQLEVIRTQLRTFRRRPCV